MWLAAALVALLLAAGCGSGGGGGTEAPPGATSDEAILGPMNPATGTPIKVGVFGEGRSPGIDNSFVPSIAKATAKWLNERKGGFGGHPIELVTCESDFDPGKALECANTYLSENVALVVLGGSANVTQFWPILHKAKIPVVLYGSATPTLMEDPDSTFMVSNPLAFIDFPAAAAKERKTKRVDAIVLDVPAATEIYGSPSTLERYKDAGVVLNVVRVPLGTPDMAPQAVQIVRDNPDGVVQVAGYDSFCIAAFNGLLAAGFKGTVAPVGPCISDATRKSVPGSFLKGMKVVSTGPFEIKDDSDMKLYRAVADHYNAGTFNRAEPVAISVFATMAAANAGLVGMKGEATPANIITTLKSMKETRLPVGGGLRFRCNGKAVPGNPALCVRGALIGTLGADGFPESYTPFSNTTIGN
ncbi:hypothetical protein BCD48_27710 [Pseudofrankia sp. BMG5.36]|nr:hypothetical protein BCD48_27710 [Pseudofrankia sp. BMG5.36]